MLPRTGCLFFDVALSWPHTSVPAPGWSARQHEKQRSRTSPGPDGENGPDAVVVPPTPQDVEQGTSPQHQRQQRGAGSHGPEYDAAGIPPRAAAPANPAARHGLDQLYRDIVEGTDGSQSGAANSEEHAMRAARMIAEAQGADLADANTLIKEAQGEARRRVSEWMAGHNRDRLGRRHVGATRVDETAVEAPIRAPGESKSRAVHRAAAMPQRGGLEAARAARVTGAADSPAGEGTVSLPPVPGEGGVLSHRDMVTRRTGSREGGQEGEREGAEPPLRSLAARTVGERRLNERRLLGLLRKYGRYPDRFRLLVWRFLLRLPENAGGFRQLLRRGPHPAWASSLGARYRMRQGRLRSRLERCLSALSHWAPVLGECAFLPALAFPFVKLFGTDELAAFETVMTVLVHWGRDWLATFPVPPIPRLSLLARQLAHVDPPVAAKLEELDVSVQDYAWPLLCSLMTEVLDKRAWLTLWDHLLSHPAAPSLLQCAAVAFLVQFRGAILSARSAADVAAFVRTQQAVDARQLVRDAYAIQRATPIELQPPEASDLVATCSPDDAVTFDEQREAAEKREAAGEGAVSLAGPGAGGGDSVFATFPLPAEAYPVYSRYPSFVVDYQLQERQRLAVEEAETARKRDLLQRLEQRAAVTRQSEAQWEAEQRHLLEAEAKRRAEAARREQDLLDEKQRLDEALRTRRLQHVAEMEEQARRALDHQRSVSEAEHKRLQDELARRERALRYEVERLGEEEAVLDAEWKTAQRVGEMQSKQEVESAAAARRRALEAGTQREELEQRKRREEREAEDEERRARLRTRREAAMKMLRENEAARRDAEARHAEYMARLQREAEEARAERARRVRRVEEEEAEKAEAATSTRQRAAELEAREEEEEDREALAKLRVWRAEKARERTRALEAAKQQQAEEAEQREARLAAVERAQRRRVRQAHLEEQQQEEVAEAQKEEQAVQRAVSQVQRQQAADRRAELALLMRERESREAEAFQRALREAADHAIESQRGQFAARSQRHQRQAQGEEAAQAQQHERALAARIEERARQLQGARAQQGAGAGPVTSAGRSPRRETPAGNGGARRGGAGPGPAPPYSGSGLRSHEELAAAMGASPRRGAGTAPARSDAAPAPYSAPQGTVRQAPRVEDLATGYGGSSPGSDASDTTSSLLEQAAEARRAAEEASFAVRSSRQRHNGTRSEAVEEAEAAVLRHAEERARRSGEAAAATFLGTRGPGPLGESPALLPAFSAQSTPMSQGAAAGPPAPHGVDADQSETTTAVGALDGDTRRALERARALEMEVQRMMQDSGAQWSGQLAPGGSQGGETPTTATAAMAAASAMESPPRVTATPLEPRSASSQALGTRSAAPHSAGASTLTASSFGRTEAEGDADPVRLSVSATSASSPAQRDEWRPEGRGPAYYE